MTDAQFTAMLKLVISAIQYERRRLVTTDPAKLDKHGIRFASIVADARAILVTEK